MNPDESGRNFSGYPVIKFDGTNHEEACLALGLEAGDFLIAMPGGRGIVMKKVNFDELAAQLGGRQTGFTA